MSKRGIPVFFIEPTGDSRYWLRRYSTVREGTCNGRSYHNAQAKFGKHPADADLDQPPHDDPRWPTKCEHCDHQFTEDDHWQILERRIYRRHDDNSVLMLLENAPPGAIWNAEWLADRERGDESRMWIGPDDRALMCKCPDGHDWHIDGQASNCTMPDDHVHKCWVRTGRPEDGTLHVSKGKPGESCAAGAGSIQTGKWHGFLHHGHLVG